MEIRMVLVILWKATDTIWQNFRHMTLYPSIFIFKNILTHAYKKMYSRKFSGTLFVIINTHTQFKCSSIEVAKLGHIYKNK